jgi:CheY-like chemotaxis protein
MELPPAVVEPSIAEVLCLILEEEGYEVVIAANGQEGLKRIAEVRPNLVLCDIMMPVLSGADMYHAMQADPDLRDIPVVLMSTSDAVAAATAAGASNYIGFLRKPFHIEALMLFVTSALGLPE